MLFTETQLKAIERTLPMQQLVYMMSSRFRAANRALNQGGFATVQQEEAWIKLFQGEVDSITYLLGTHRARGFQYDVPTYLAEAIDARGPVHLDFRCPDTSPDRIVGWYLHQWWDAEKILSIMDQVPKWADIQEEALIVHSKFLEEVYEPKAEVPISVFGHSSELQQLEALRDAIARGATTLDVEINRLSDKAGELEDRLHNSSQSIVEMELEYRSEYQLRALDAIKARQQREMEEEGSDDDENTGRPPVSIPTLLSERLRRPLPKRKGRTPIRHIPRFTLLDSSDGNAVHPDVVHLTSTPPAHPSALLPVTQDLTDNGPRKNFDVMMVTDDDFNEAVANLSL